ncbi:hypothetical protein RMATCC62417_18661 [Rhizopus microsporus]|nr:hypothetical protein RMATCC62417_18661 [Rhizopus microsporus]
MILYIYIKYIMPKKTGTKKTNELKIEDIQKAIENLTKRIKQLEINVKVKEKKNKNSNLPKKHKSAYIFFYIEKVEDFKRKNPEKKLNVTEIAKESGKEWNKIKNDNKKIDKYIKMEKEDRKRVEKEKDLESKI